MDLIGTEGIARYQVVSDPDNPKYGELIKCLFCGQISEIYTDTCPFCHRRFVDKNHIPYIPKNESED